MESAAIVPSVWSTTLEEPPSCLAFCSEDRELVVVGTYLLHPSNEDGRKQGEAEDDEGVKEDDQNDDEYREERQQKRSGSLILLRVKEGSNEIEQIQTLPIPTASVLDIQWCPHRLPIGPLLAVATSIGHLDFYRLHHRDQDGPELLPYSTHEIAHPSFLVLFLVWNPQDPQAIGVTLSTGAVVLCRSDTPPGHDPWDTTVSIDRQIIHKHDLEAWTLAFLPTEPENGLRILSGGDDCVLRLSNAWSDRKIHSAGVTAILPLGSGDLVVTGSYDDHLRLIKCPATGRREVLQELNLGGGVWRISALGSLDGHVRESTHGSITLLVSCMHAGTRVVRLHRRRDESGAEIWEFEVLVRFEEHKSMNYGSAAQPCDGKLKTVVSTSFYDRLLCLWRVDIGV